MRLMRAALLGFAVWLGAGSAAAEPMRLDVVLTTQESISLGFKNEEGHFLTLLRREGTAEGEGRFVGAAVAEYGMHDVAGGEQAEASGYIEATTAAGAIAYFRFQLRAFFVKGTDGNTTVINDGLWELAGGTGDFAALRGVGNLRIEFVGKTERRYILEGDLSPAP